MNPKDRPARSFSWTKTVARCAAVVFAVAAPVVAVASACSSTNDAVQHGDCLKKNGDSFDRASCSDSVAAYVVLDRAGQGHAHEKCVDVAGTEYDYSDDDGYVCVGDKGADPAHAVNVAKVGDCLTGIDGSSVQRVNCTDATARYRVLGRDTTGMIGLNMACQGVKGTERTYSYELKVTRGIGKGFGDGVTFCLAARNTDTSRTPDNAQIGNCLQETGANEVQIVDCADPAAAYRVLSTAGLSVLCDNVSGVIATYSFQPPGQLFSTYLCLGAAG